MINNWIGGNSNDWSDAANWSAGCNPWAQSTSTACISGSAWQPVSVSCGFGNGGHLSNGLEVGPYATVTIDAVGHGLVFSTSSVTIDAHGKLIIDTASAVSLGPVKVNGTLDLEGARSVALGTISGSGSLVLDNSQLGSASCPVSIGSGVGITIEGGSALYLNDIDDGKSITFGSGTAANNLFLPDQPTNFTTPITNFNASSIISVDSGCVTPRSAALVANPTGDTYSMVIKLADGKSITLSNISLAPGYHANSYAVQSNRDGSWSIVPNDNPPTCFLPGSRILTERGAIAVEDLRIGDTLITAHDSGAGLAPVVWVGTQHVRVLPDRPADMANAPVRIAADAIAPGIPARDLRVTAEHCLYLGGCMVPARMLVNGASIAYDRSVTSFDTFHVETERHSVIVAEGLPTESYLDTGNRSNFAQTGAIAALRIIAPRSWETDAAAPLTTDAAFVEPLHRALAARSAEIGMALPEAAARTAEPMLGLQTEDGTILGPVETTDGRITFAIPPRSTRVVVLSRSARPSDAFGPWLDDRRDLGVLLGDVVLREGGVSGPVDLEAITAAGWWPTAGATRWTDGAAILPLQRRHMDGVARLTLSVLAAPSYALEAETAQDIVANG